MEGIGGGSREIPGALTIPQANMEAQRGAAGSLVVVVGPVSGFSGNSE